MKDVIIPGRRVARELLIFFGCLIVAFFVNVYAIHKYKTDWKELITTLHITIAAGIVIYMLFGFIRLLVCGVARLLRRKAG